MWVYMTSLLWLVENSNEKSKKSNNFAVGGSQVNKGLPTVIIRFYNYSET